MGRRITKTGADVNQQIITDVYVYTANEDGSVKRETKARALWDTGATDSQITREVAERLHMEPVGTGISNNAGGSKRVNVYRGRLYFKEGLHIAQDIFLPECNGGGRFDCVIGMDIIQYGRMTLEGCGDERTFTFEV